MTAQDLKSRSLKDLAQLAKRHGVPGWQGMKKDALLRAVARAMQRKAAIAAASRHKSNGAAKARNGSHAARNGHSSNGHSSNGHAANGHRPTAISRTTNSRAVNGRVAKKPAVATANRIAPRPVSSRPAARDGAARNGVPSKNGGAANGAHAAVNGANRKAALASQRIRQLQMSEDRRKNLATAAERGVKHRDRLVALVRDPFWLHAHWELSRQAVERARVAMGQDWHSAQPILRLSEVCGGEGTSTVERLVRDIPIHGGVSNWYVDVKDPPKSYRLDIGYVSANARFFSLARSNIVATPKAGTSDALDNNWNDVAANFDKIYAMNGGSSENGADSELEELFEERLRRPLNSSALTQYAVQLNGFGKHPAFNFEVDAELIVFGTTEPDAHVTLHGEPIEVRPDGSFTVRYSLPNCRQVIPAVARSRDGLETRTIVLAVERNTKTMEPVMREGSE